MSPGEPYQIVGWAGIYENARSKEFKQCSYLCVPNNDRGDLGLISILGERDGAAIYGNFILVARLCSLQPKPREGWLTHNGQRDGEPYTITTLSLALRRPKFEIARLLQVTSSKNVGWIAPEFDLAKLTEGERQELLGSNNPDAGRAHPNQGFSGALDCIPNDLPLLLGSASPKDGCVRPNNGSKSPDRIEPGQEPHYELDTNSHPESGRVLPDSGCESPLIEEKRIDKNPLPSPKGGFEEVAVDSDVIQHAEAKSWLNQIFGRKRPWSYEEDHLLSEILPISREDKESIDWAYRLPPDHRFYEQTRLKQEITTLLRGFNGEIDKIRSVRNRLGMTNGLGPAAKTMQVEDWPAGYADAALEIYGETMRLPRKYSELAASVRVHIEAHIAARPIEANSIHNT